MKRLIVVLLFLLPLAHAAECEPGDFRFNIFSDTMLWCVDGQWENHPTSPAHMCIDYDLFKDEYGETPVKGPNFLARIGTYLGGLFEKDQEEIQEPEEKIVEEPAHIQEEEPQCIPQQEICDGVDNDCDNEVDEDYSLNTDVNNCGVCGNTCAEYNNQVAQCIVGSCSVKCEDLYIDYDGKITNGCECAPDEHEPNNLRDKATVLGELAIGESTTITARTPFEFDADYYKFYAQGQGEFTIKAVAKGDESQYIELCLFRDEAIASRMLSCGKGSVSYNGLPQIFARERWYYIQVYPIRKNSCEDYTITFHNN